MKASQRSGQTLGEAGVDNTIADTLSHHPLANTEEPNDNSHSSNGTENKVKELFVIQNDSNNVAFPLTLALVRERQQQEIRNRNSKINTYNNIRKKNTVSKNEIMNNNFGV